MVQQQREALKESLRAACRENRLRPGDAAPSLRQLGKEFSLSQGVVVAALRELAEEGLFHTIERLGTFVGPPRPRERPLFFLIHQPDAFNYAQVRGGFEERVAALGGGVMTIDRELTRQLLRDGKFPDCAGVFELSAGVSATIERLSTEEKTEVETPQIKSFVGFGIKPHHENCDTVAFDDIAGGRLAAEHLISLGHERIAFLGVHRAAKANGDGVPEWSFCREQGWRKALGDAGFASVTAFHARSRWSGGAENDATYRESAQSFVQSFARGLAGKGEAVSAAVVANDLVATAVFETLREKDIARALWPAVVSFDGMAAVQNEVLTSLRLPWEKLGACAAEMLWERSHEMTRGAPMHRDVAMRLIPRLSCRTDWNALALAN